MNESMNSLSLVVIGHVDSGKSTLIGNIMYQMKLISEKTLNKNKNDSMKLGKGSFYLAWVTDETTEERERGITIDISHNKFCTEKYLVEIIDCPGHKEFTMNTINGIFEADTGIVIIDSTTGSFESGFCESGQTKEHILICRFLGITKMIVVINKMDKCDYDKNRYDEIVDSVKTFLRKSSFNVEKDVYFVPISAIDGINITKKTDSCDLYKWYNGSTLLEIIDQLKAPERLISKPLRISVSSYFKTKTKTFQIYGKIESGSITKNTTLISFPHNIKLEIISIGEDSSDTFYAGSHISFIAKSLSDEELENGSILCQARSPCLYTNKYHCKITIFKIEQPILIGTILVLHSLQRSMPFKISKIISCQCRNSSPSKLNQRMIIGESQCEVYIITESPIAFDLFENVKTSSRFLIRMKNNTIGVGIVIGTYQ